MTRELAKEEGIIAGLPCGAALRGVIQLKNKLKENDIVVVILPDHGSRYLAKIFNDDWMKKNKFI